MDLSALSEHEILNLKLSELSRLPVPRWIHILINQVRSELVAKQIPFCPHFWFGTEWFSPDGVPGLAIPYYLLHPKLIKLERKYTKHVEGTSSQEFLQLARHEIGHAIDNAYGLRKLKIRNKLFGPISTPYPTSYVANPYSKNFVRHLKGNYAQAHPEEDWAETFAVWLNPTNQWRKKYAEWPALEKLEYMNSIMQNLQGVAPRNNNRKTPYNITSDNRTLKQYFLDKQKERKVNRKDFFVSRLPKFYNQSQGKQLSQIIAANERLLLQRVKEKTNLQSYKVAPMIKLLKRETRGRYISKKVQEQKVINVLSNILIKEENRFKKQGRHRIIM